MKGVLIFDEKADLAFYYLDEGMEKFFLDRVMELEGEAGAPVSASIDGTYVATFTSNETSLN